MPVYLWGDHYDFGSTIEHYNFYEDLESEDDSLSLDEQLAELTTFTDCQKKNIPKTIKIDDHG